MTTPTLQAISACCGAETDEVQLGLNHESRKQRGNMCRKCMKLCDTPQPESGREIGVIEMVQLVYGVKHCPTCRSLQHKVEELEKCLKVSGHKKCDNCSPSPPKK